MERILLGVAIFVLVFFSITFAGYVKAYYDGQLVIQIAQQEVKAMETRAQQGPAAADKSIQEEITALQKRYEVDGQLKDRGIEVLKPEEIVNYKVAFVTNYGTIVVAFHPNGALMHGKKFLALAANEVYNQSFFHRIYADAVVFGGGPIRDEPDEYLADEIKLKHERGAVSLSNQGRTNTGSREFFICLKPIGDYDKKYSVFGYVDEGINVVEEMSRKAVIMNNFTKEKDCPAAEIKVVKVLVLKAPKNSQEKNKSE